MSCRACLEVNPSMQTRPYSPSGRGSGHPGGHSAMLGVLTRPPAEPIDLCLEAPSVLVQTLCAKPSGF